MVHAGCGFGVAFTRPWFILSSRRVLGNGVRTHVNYKGKIPSTVGLEEVWTCCAAWRRTASPTHYLLSYSGPQAVCLFVGCLTSQQHASASQGRICSDKFMCCHIEIEVADQTFHLTQSQYTDTGPTSPRADPISPSTWQDSQWCASF